MEFIPSHADAEMPWISCSSLNMWYQSYFVASRSHCAAVFAAASIITARLKVPIRVGCY